MTKSIALCALGLLLGITTPALAMTDAQCNEAFATADVDKDGFISEAEAGRYFAAHRVANKPIADGKLARDAFLTNCKADMYMTSAPEVGAPLAGANSFTETQAKDRVLRAGFGDVSALAKDDKGIWRGTAMQDGKKVTVAVDFKGNIVAN
jgi:hypothetical protein